MSGSRTTRSGRTARRDEPVGQTLAHRMAVAERIILENLGRKGYGELHTAAAEALRIDRQLAGSAFWRALLDLERRDVITHGVDGIPRAHDPAVDPPLAPLPEVATAILALEWPRPVGRKDVHSIFVDTTALGHRVRHSDVYDALWDHLYGHELEHVGRTTWRPRGTFDRLAALADDPTAPPELQLEAERELEQQLVAEYVASLDHSVYTEWKPTRLAGYELLRADIYDPSTRTVIEAKGGRGLVTVAHAVGQALVYRQLANLERETVDHIAVLMRERPSEQAQRYVRLTLDLSVTFIWPDGDGFRGQLVD